jgi:hypothetical protein
VVQSAAYGEALPVIVGTMRAAGNLIWSSGISEQVARSGGGKGGSATNQYSYSASFAVGLAARTIVGVRRIWADGRLVREADGSFLLPMVMRLHRGDEGQAADPLLAAAEGASQTPAYRGMAYAVFEDLALGEFGNRIPNLTFEIIADQAGDGTSLDLGDAARALVEVAEKRGSKIGLRVEGPFPLVSGYYFGRPASMADALQPLIEMIDGTLVASGDGLLLQDLETPVNVAAVEIAESSTQARTDTQGRTRDRQTYGGDRGPDIVEMGFYDVTRDYQPGLQRMRRGHGSRLRQGVLSAAMTPDAAKSLAARLLSRGQASRLTRALSLPWRDLGLTPGMLVRLEGADDVWRIREVRFENFVMALSLERLTASTGRAVRADGGRALQFSDMAAGATTLQFLELPGLGGGVPAVPALYMAGAGASAGWRRAGFELSTDNGASYSSAGMIPTPTVMGTTVDALRAGPTMIWDQNSYIDVVLLGSHMWLESKGDLAVLQGANLALVGDELVQFGQAEAFGPRQFRLTRLLRGRRGTEWATAEHSAGERFVLLDTPALAAVQASVGMIGQTLQARPTGPFDGGADSQALMVKGTSLQPLAPVHVRMRQEGGDIVITWTRRSRGGFAWLDFVDAPLSEVREAYHLRILLDDVVVREQEVIETQFRYDFSDRVADGGGGTVGVEIAQLSAVAGPGRAAAAVLVVN